jgi:hypothetical protein
MKTLELNIETLSVNELLSVKGGRRRISSGGADLVVD